MASHNPSTNGPLPHHPPTPVTPTTVEKFLGIPTTISIYFACTLFTLVETLAVMLSGVAGASYDSLRLPLAAAPFVAVLFVLLLWHQRRRVRDLLPRSHPDCEAGSPATGPAADAATAEAVIGPEGAELLMLFAGFQAVVLSGTAFLMLVLTCWVGHAGAAIVAGALGSGVGVWGFVEFCGEIGGLEDVTAVGGKKGTEEREEQPEVVEEESAAAAAAPPPSTPGTKGGEKLEEHQEHQEVAEASAAPPPSTTGTGTKQPAQPLHRRLSCIPEEEGDDPSEHDGDNHPPADLVLSQQMQDLVWNRVRFLAARGRPSERRRMKLLLRRAMRESQGGKDEGNTSVTFSSGQTMVSNPIFPPPPPQQQQQQTFPAMDTLSPLPAAMDRTDAQQQRQQQQERHIEAINHLARAKDSEIATLRTQMEGMTRYFRTREEAYRAAHAAEVANAWRNAQVLFEKVGKLEGRLTAEKIARKEVGVGEGEWIGVGSTEREERMGRKLGIFAQGEEREAWVGVGNGSVRKQQQQQQQQQEEDESVEEEVSKGNNVEGPVIDLPLCQNAGCFCHFPVVPQQPKQQQRQEETSRDEQEVTIVSQDHNAEICDGDENDDDDTFTIILDSDPPSLPSSSSHDVESPNNPSPLNRSENLLFQNADCFCHFPVVVRPYLPHTGQTGQRRKDQPAQNEDRRLIVPEHGTNAGSQNRTEKDNAETDEQDDGKDDDAFTIIIESRSPPPPSSSRRAESPEDLVSVEGSEITLSEWEVDSDSDFDGLDERGEEEEEEKKEEKKKEEKKEKKEKKKKKNCNL
ncbi:hypothetical protein KC333_g1355 [Hortaea werneckii]|nr:hypothetical protein KC333_g1355 [Hortaea werneckii]KAI7320826.1 hypothetical protein KC326_g2574 [Hortaea werneckii]